MYKLVAFDMDGTLLNEDKKVSRKVRRCIDEIRKMGVKVILISGRGYNGIKRYVEELDIRDLAVTLNGAAVINPINEDIVFSECLDCDTARGIMEMNEKSSTYTLLFTGRDIFIESLNEKSRIYEDNDGIKVTKVGRILDFYKNQPVGKLLMIDEHDKLSVLREEIKERFNGSVNLTFSFPYFLEAYSPYVDKGITLSKVANYYGIKREEVIALGDGENDIPMLSYAGLGVAMGNAPDFVKSKADFVTETNVQDGAAKVIEKFILKKIYC